MSALVELAERVEAATTASYDLNVAINRAVKGFPASWPTSYRGALVSDYSASLDAAMQLVPEGYWIEMQIGDTRSQVRFGRNGEWNNDPALSGYAATPALALTAAALRARAQHEGDDNG